MNFCGSVINGKLTPKRSFLSSQQGNRAIKYLDLVRTDQIAEEDFLSPLKVHPTVLLGDLYPLLDFNVLHLSLPLYSARFYQIILQLRNYSLSDSKTLTYFL